MGSIHLSGFAWITYAGIFVCSSAIIANFLWRITLRDRNLRSSKSFRRSILTVARSGRGGRLKRFENIANAVVTDVNAALQPPLCHHHARSFLPIVSDVRRRGQSLLEQQTTAHRVASPDREKYLTQIVLQLLSLETQLKALPKHSVTIEDVLLGKFD